MRRTLVHFFCILSLSLWVGGFTFYSAVVIPVLHESLSHRETGLVTQRVTDYINGAGVITLAFWWLAVRVEPSTAPHRVRRRRRVLLIATTLILVGLILLHRVMDGRIQSGSLEGFYPLHRVYLIASTLQWFVNVGLLALMPAFWRQPTRAESSEDAV